MLFLKQDLGSYLSDLAHRVLELDLRLDRTGLQALQARGCDMSRSDWRLKDLASCTVTTSY